MTDRLPHISSLPSNSAYTRHVQRCLQYVHFYGGSAPKIPKGKTERDLLEESFEFIRNDDDQQGEKETKDTAKEMARRYYDNLFREYALVDLSRYKEGQVALRWRTKQEVLNGIGHFTCASLHCSHHNQTADDEKTDLETFEMNFSYVEKETSKNALVKVRLCERCARKIRKVNRDRVGGGGGTGGPHHRHRRRHRSWSRSRSRSGSRSKRHDDRRSHSSRKERARESRDSDGSHDSRGYSSRRREEEKEYDSDGRRSRRDNRHDSRDRPSRHDEERRRKHRSRSPEE